MGPGGHRRVAAAGIGLLGAVAGPLTIGLLAVLPPYEGALLRALHLTALYELRDLVWLLLAVAAFSALGVGLSGVWLVIAESDVGPPTLLGSAIGLCTGVFTVLLLWRWDRWAGGALDGWAMLAIPPATLAELARAAVLPALLCAGPGASLLLIAAGLAASVESELTAEPWGEIEGAAGTGRSGGPHPPR